MTSTPKRPAAACEERLEIGGRSLPLVIVRSPRARRAALRVDATRGEIRLTLPPRVAEARARRLIETHREWIADRVAPLPLPRPFMSGAEIDRKSVVSGKSVSGRGELGGRRI